MNENRKQNQKLETLRIVKEYFINNNFFLKKNNKNVKEEIIGSCFVFEEGIISLCNLIKDIFIH
jgi:hypothetical protein